MGAVWGLFIWKIFSFPSETLLVNFLLCNFFILLSGYCITFIDLYSLSNLSHYLCVFILLLGRYSQLCIPIFIVIFAIMLF